MPEAEPKSFTVPPALDGARVDVVITDLAEGWSRSRVQKAIKDGALQINGEAVLRPNTQLSKGDELQFKLDDDREISTDIRGRKIQELDVLLEDEAFAVINKPAGLVVHPSARQLAGTVADLAVARYGPLPEVQGEDRPGVVHRLDRMTSGVLVLGRTEEALLNLKAQFKARTVEKTYLAIVHGCPRFETEWLTGAIASTPKNPDRMRVVPEKVRERLVAEGEARTAETLLERREDFKGVSLVAAKPKTGRTHQIRVHLLENGLPIVGDRVYKQGGSHKHPIPREAPRMERPALHAHQLSFDHPTTGERVSVEVPMPDDMQGLLDWLRANPQ